MLFRSLETQAEVIGHHAAHGGELVQLSVARAVPLGRFHGFRPAMPIVQWTWEKPVENLGTNPDPFGYVSVEDPGTFRWIAGEELVENPGDAPGTDGGDAVSGSVEKSGDGGSAT